MKKRNYFFIIICLLLCGQSCSLVAMKPNVLKSYRQLYDLVKNFRADEKNNVFLCQRACEQRKKYIIEKVGFHVLHPKEYWFKRENAIVDVSPLCCYWDKYRSVCVSMLLYENSENGIKDLYFKQYQLAQNGKIDRWVTKWHNVSEAVLLHCVHRCFDTGGNFCLYSCSSSDIIEHSISSKGVTSMPCKLSFKRNNGWCDKSLVDIKEEAFLKVILTSDSIEANIFDEGVMQTVQRYPMSYITFPDIHISHIEKDPVFFYSWLWSLGLSEDACHAIKQAVFIQAVSQKLEKQLSVGS